MPAKQSPRPTTEKQVEANRRNARASTGPKTEAGKRRSSLNATKHGLYARSSAAIPSGPFAEDPGGVDGYVEDIVTHLAPRSTLAATVARAVAQEALTIERIARVEPYLLVKDGDPLFGGGTENLAMHSFKAAVSARLADALNEAEVSADRDYQELVDFILILHEKEGVEIDGPPYEDPSGPSTPEEWKRTFDWVVESVLGTPGAAHAWARDIEQKATRALKMVHADQAAQVSEAIGEGLAATSGLRSRTLRSLHRTLETYALVNDLDSPTGEGSPEELQDAERTHFDVKPVSNELGQTADNGVPPVT